MGDINSVMIFTIVLVLLVAVVITKMVKASNRDKSPRNPGRDTDTRDDHES